MPAEPRLRTRITAEPLDGGTLLSDLGGVEDGGVALFLGRVRSRNGGRNVVRLTYDAYPEMAELELGRICEDVAARYPLGELRAVHRTGSLVPGEVSVGVAAAAPHRGDAFAACRAVIEEIKRRLPVWKLEAYEDGTERWLDGTPAPARGGRKVGTRGAERAGEPG